MGAIRYNDQQGQYNLATGTSAMSLEVYRDTAFIIEHCRHDQDDVIGYFKFQFSHAKMLNTAVTSVHIHCVPVGANPASPQVVRFGYSYTWQNSSGTFPANASWTTSTSDMTVATTDQFKGKIHSIVTNITPPTNEGYSSWLLIRISRLGTDPGDTYTENKSGGTIQANLAILGVDCHVQVDGREGSVNETTD